MLPYEMFVNLIDTDLQERIAIANDLDGNAAEALKLLLEKAPAEMTTGLEDWRLENTNGRNILFYKGKNYIPKDTELRRDIVKTSMIIKQPDILVKLGLIMQYDNITGGKDSGPLSKTTYRDVGLVNDSRLTEHQPSQHTY